MDFELIDNFSTFCARCDEITPEKRRVRRTRSKLQKLTLYRPPLFQRSMICTIQKTSISSISGIHLKKRPKPPFAAKPTGTDNLSGIEPHNTST